MLDVEPTPRAPRPVFDAGSVLVVAAVLAGFIALTTLVLRPELITDRLYALAAGVLLGVLTLVVTPRRRNAAEPAGGGSLEPLTDEVEMHRWSLQALERSNRQLADEVRQLRSRVNDLEGRGPDARANGDPMGWSRN
ncbi:MAG: hypothetical protein IT196_23930 [Acidimicrobiales bacterium]|nr:hypothetical protein [Acidimicrobiales bacterium]